MKNVFRVLRGSLTLIYPRRCPICDELILPGKGLICKECSSLPVRIREPFCMRCGKQLQTQDGEYCKDCLKKKHAYDRGRALFRYDDLMRESVVRFKYKKRQEYKEYYSREMAEVFREQVRIWQPDVIIPIPIHKERKKTRGYNQAGLLASMLSKEFLIPVDEHYLVREGKTDPQKKLGSNQRKKNMRGAFTVKGRPGIYGKVLLVDDIYTTGSTIDAAAEILKACGTQRVYFLCLSIGNGSQMC